MSGTFVSKDLLACGDTFLLASTDSPDHIAPNRRVSTDLKHGNAFVSTGDQACMARKPGASML